MKKLILVLALGLILGVATSASASLITTINAGPEVPIWDIYNTLYSTGYISAADILPLENDVAIGGGLFYDMGGGKIYWVARYAADTHGLYAYDSDSTGPVYYPDGILNNSTVPPSSSNLYSLPAGISAPFGFFVWDQNKNTNWYSQIGLNSDGKYHFLVLNAPADHPNELLVAVEDLKNSSADWDYNDVAFVIKNIAPVPEPASMMLLGMGILGLVGLKRKA